MVMIPKDHPRYESLKVREALVDGYEKGVTVLEGLIAHGRGEAFDYLIGEETIAQAEKAIEASTALLLTAEDPVISVNGNTAALCPEELIDLASIINAKLEVNLFHRSVEREKLIEEVLKEHGAEKVYGIDPTKEIEGLSSERRKVDEGGIYTSDVVLVALEDGDRTEALIKNGKRVIAIDLNPLSRTARCASITIVDNVIRAVPRLIEVAERLNSSRKEELLKIVENFDNRENLKSCLRFINKRLEKLE
ncbi:MAG: 4-phosphopantoate--beta-alanine ligase [Candidatus Hydrothermarchaeales archaeon]